MDAMNRKISFQTLLKFAKGACFEPEYLSRSLAAVLQQPPQQRRGRADPLLPAFLAPFFPSLPRRGRPQERAVHPPHAAGHQRRGDRGRGEDPPYAGGQEVRAARGEGGGGPWLWRLAAAHPVCAGAGCRGDGRKPALPSKTSRKWTARREQGRWGGLWPRRGAPQDRTYREFLSRFSSVELFTVVVSTVTSLAG